jgi:hypothetical protein
VGDNAEFMFLEMGQWALFLDIKCRTLRKVYGMANNDRLLGDIYPFMMIWPPTFPALKDDPTRFASWTLDDLYITLLLWLQLFAMFTVLIDIFRRVLLVLLYAFNLKYVALIDTPS